MEELAGVAQTHRSSCTQLIVLDPAVQLPIRVVCLSGESFLFAFYVWKCIKKTKRSEIKEQKQKGILRTLFL